MLRNNYIVKVAVAFQRTKGPTRLSFVPQQPPERPPQRKEQFRGGNRRLPHKDQWFGPRAESPLRGISCRATPSDMTLNQIDSPGLTSRESSTDLSLNTFIPLHPTNLPNYPSLSSVYEQKLYYPARSPTSPERNLR